MKLQHWIYLVRDWRPREFIDYIISSFWLFYLNMIRYFIEKFKTAKAEYLSRTPKGKWEFVRNTGIMLLRVTGVPVIDPNFKFYWWSWACGGVILDVTVSFIYSLWYYNYKLKDPITGLLNIPLYFGILVPVSKLILYVILILYCTDGLSIFLCGNQIIRPSWTVEFLNIRQKISKISDFPFSNSRR